MDDGLLQIFPTPITVTKYKGSLTKELKYINTLEYIKQKDNGNLQSKDVYLLKHKEFKNIKNFINKCIDKFTTKIYESDQKLIVTQCWLNRNPKGSNHHRHCHPNSIISGVFYFKQNSKLPPIQFSKTLQYSMTLHTKKFNNLNSHTFYLPCTDGELVIFPSDLNHHVPTNTSDEERISMSFNTFSIDVLGLENALTELNIPKLIDENI
mgnify:FL=1|jgi:uncharacterized protein (TIGR02466 family)|tara:strand:- start:842 stop:1468 length:627 start_codon:yes stop_codon:yes gene_type:complete